MKKIAFLLAGLAGWAMLAGAPAQAQQDGTREFVSKVAQDNLAEVELGRLASQQAHSPAVKEFAQRMINDHGRAGQELTQLARSKGMSLPTTIDATHAALRDRLGELSGADFDRVYMDEMVKDHAADVAEFERQSQRLDDPDARAWAGKTLPTLQAHLAQARSVHAQVAGQPGAGAASPPTLGAAPQAPAATTTTTTTTVVTAPRPAPGAAVTSPWCNGQWLPGMGTNFASCPGR